MKPLRFAIHVLGIAAIFSAPQAFAQETGCCQPMVLRAPIVLDSSPASARIQPWPVAVARFDEPRPIVPVVTPPSTSPLVLPPPPSYPLTSSTTIVRGQTSPVVLAKPVTSYRPITTIPAVPPYRIGKGIFGQPKLYVPNQPVRNFFRSISL